MKAFYCAALFALAFPASVIAQTGSNAPASPSFPQFGVWLDDASLEGRGTARVTIGAGLWRTPDGHQVDVPMIDAGYDFTDRVRLSAFVPFYRAQFGEELTSGLDDLYFSSKIILANGADGGVGLAVSPALEIQNSASATRGRVHWALPISAEVRPVERLRIYGAGGYFSRGAAFGGIAAEWTATARSIVSVSLTHSYAIETGTALTPTTSDRHLTAAGFTLTQLVSDRLAVYFNIGRAILHADSSSPTTGVGGGISIRFP